MKKTVTIIYSIIVSLVLIFAITFFAVNIYNENSHGSLRTQVRFEKLVSGSRAAFEKSNITSSERIRQIENSIGDNKDFSYIQIQADNKIIYLFPEDFEDSQEVSSKLVIPYTRSITVNGTKLTLTCGLYSLRPSSIFEYAKISFLIILIVTLFTIILIIYNNHSSAGQNKKPYIKKIKKPAAKKELDYEEEELSYQDDSSEIVEEPEEESKEAAPEEKRQEPSYGKIEIKKEELPIADYEPVEILEEEKASENGLFSPDTGIGWESYLMTRLENELNRATASELDLALFIIKFDGISLKNPIMKKVCDYLIVEFQFKDLLFEYKDDSICGIKISMDIDNAIPFAEKLVAEIKKITSQESLTVLAGITTRGIRMVSAERLIKEADEAIKHAAKEHDSPIVGFRADAVKYRKFLENN